MQNSLKPIDIITNFKNLLPLEGRLIAFDYGEKRIGIASSDSQRYVATPRLTINYNSNQSLLSQIKIIVDEIKPVGFVVGLPVHMNNNESNSSEKAREFAKLIQSQHPALPILLFDERLTSAIAERMMIAEADLSRKKRAKHRDKLAACILLQTVLEYLRNNSKK